MEIQKQKLSHIPVSLEQHSVDALGNVSVSEDLNDEILVVQLAQGEYWLELFFGKMHFNGLHQYSFIRK